MDNELYELVNYRYERAIETLIANFNKEYVATEIFPRSMGRRISTLALIRERGMQIW